MIYLFYTTYISVDIAHHEVFRAKVGMGGIKRDIIQHYKCGHTFFRFGVNKET